MATIPLEDGRRTPKRPSPAARRVGYLIGAAINGLLIWLVNVAPGWWWVPFLTEDFGQVVWLITLSLLVGLAIDLGQVAYDPPWVRRLGDTVTAAFAVVILYRLWSIFPFDLGERWSGWTTPLRVVLLLATIGTAIGLVASFAQFLRIVVHEEPSGDAHHQASAEQREPEVERNELTEGEDAGEHEDEGLSAGPARGE
jgi:hypothetical protein